MPSFNNARLVRYCVVGFIAFIVLGAAATYFVSTRISPPEVRDNPQPAPKQGK